MNSFATLILGSVISRLDEIRFTFWIDNPDNLNSVDILRPIDDSECVLNHLQIFRIHRSVISRVTRTCCHFVYKDCCRPTSSIPNIRPREIHNTP